MYLEKLGYAYLLVSLITFFFACSNELFSDPTTEMLASIFAALFWPVYWSLVCFDIEHPAITLLSSWIIIGGGLMLIGISFDKIRRILKK